MVALNARKNIRGAGGDEPMTISLSDIQSGSLMANSKVDLIYTFALNLFHIMTCSYRAISLSWWTPLENTCEIKTQTPKGPKYVLFRDVPFLFLRAYMFNVQDFMADCKMDHIRGELIHQTGSQLA
jgi:hypothetical protein